MKPERFTRNIRDKQGYCEFELKRCKYQNIYGFDDYEEIEGNVHCELSLAIDKLGELEDFEQEYGIDLVTLLKALKGIYIKPNNIYVGCPYLRFAENENRELELQFKVVDTWYKVKDINKTWALTKDGFKK